MSDSLIQRLQNLGERNHGVLPAGEAIAIVRDHIGDPNNMVKPLSNGDKYECTLIEKAARIMSDAVHDNKWDVLKKVSPVTADAEMRRAKAIVKEFMAIPPLGLPGGKSTAAVGVATTMEGASVKSADATLDGSEVQRSAGCTMEHTPSAKPIVCRAVHIDFEPENPRVTFEAPKGSSWGLGLYSIIMGGAAVGAFTVSESAVGSADSNKAEPASPANLPSDTPVCLNCGNDPKRKHPLVEVFEAAERTGETPKQPTTSDAPVITRFLTGELTLVPAVKSDSQKPTYNVFNDSRQSSAIKTMLAACEGLEDLEDCMRAAYHALGNEEYLRAPEQQGDVQVKPFSSRPAYKDWQTQLLNEDPVQVCPECDIAGCRCIRDRKAKEKQGESSDVVSIIADTLPFGCSEHCHDNRQELENALRPYLRTTEPVSVSLEKIAEMIDPAFFGRSAKSWEPEHAAMMREKAAERAKAILDAVEVKYVE